jgi:hypothetical protein
VQRLLADTVLVGDERINGRLTAAEALKRRPQLVEAQLVWRKYSAPSPDWDHDHCTLCWTKIMETASDDVLDAAYTDDKPSPAPSPHIDGYQSSPAGTRTWVCPICARAYRDVFNWRTRGGPVER